MGSIVFQWLFTESYSNFMPFLGIRASFPCDKEAFGYAVLYVCALRRSQRTLIRFAFIPALVYCVVYWFAVACY
jgi:hypothetical protein